MDLAEKLTDEIMRNGIARFAEGWQTDRTNVQIQISAVDDEVIYKKCIAFQPKEQIKFRDILGKADLMQRGMLAAHFIGKLIQKYAEKYQVLTNQVAGFILINKNNILAIAMYTLGGESPEYREVISLSALFEEIDLMT